MMRALIFHPISPAVALFLLLGSSPIIAQTIGGGYPTLYQWEGSLDRDLFGQTVSGAGDVNGDGHADLIVGAHWADPGGLFDAGSVFVFSGSDGTILHQWHGKSATDNLGVSVSGAGDINADGFDDVIMGSIDENGSFTQNGIAYIYSGVDGKLLYKWIGAEAFDRFGDSVSAAGDVNADGYADVIIGASNAENSAGARAGSAYVYSGADGSLLYQWDGRSKYEDFGKSISGPGDLNGDGFDDLLIGSEKEIVRGKRNAGSVTVYSGVDGTQLYRWFGMTEYDSFGRSVSGAGDINKDGFPDIIFTGSGVPAGAQTRLPLTFIYSGIDGTLLHQIEEGASSVASAGDFNRDGYSDVVLGDAWFDGNGQINVGAVSVFSGLDGKRLHQWMGLETDDQLGYSVDGAGDVNGNGYPDLIAGAPMNGYSSNRPGAAYVFGFNPQLTSNLATVSASSGGLLRLKLDFRESAALLDYQVLISATGTGPTLFGVDVPLTFDSMVRETLFGNYPVRVYRGLRGSLDLSGQATAFLVVPAGLPSALIGNTYFFATIVNRSGLLAEHSSVVVLLTITP
jgi:FG-GAP repeat protein